MARLAGYGGNVYAGALVVEDCEDVWDGTDADVTAVLDTTDYRVGSASVRFDQLVGLAIADVLAWEVIAPGTLAAYTVLFCWAKHSGGTVADDYRIGTDNDAWPADTPEVECSLPALVANVWKFCWCPVVTGAFTAATLPISVQVSMENNDLGVSSLWLDHIVAGVQVIGIREWNMDVVASVQDTSGYSDGQAKVFTVTTTEWSGSFSGFKDGPPLAIGQHIALELMEAEVALPGPSTAAWRGEAIITNMRPTSSVDGIVQYAYDFQGVYTLEWPTT